MIFLVLWYAVLAALNFYWALRFIARDKKLTAMRLDRDYWRGRATRHETQARFDRVTVQGLVDRTIDRVHTTDGPYSITYTKL